MNWFSLPDIPGVRWARRGAYSEMEKFVTIFAKYISKSSSLSFAVGRSIRICLSNLPGRSRAWRETIVTHAFVFSFNFINDKGFSLTDNKENILLLMIRNCISNKLGCFIFTVQIFQFVTKVTILMVLLLRVFASHSKSTCSLITLLQYSRWI